MKYKEKPRQQVTKEWVWKICHHRPYHNEFSIVTFFEYTCTLEHNRKSVRLSMHFSSRFYVHIRAFSRKTRKKCLTILLLEHKRTVFASFLTHSHRHAYKALLSFGSRL
jgi:hypothetical protein